MATVHGTAPFPVSRRHAWWAVAAFGAIALAAADTFLAYKSSPAVALLAPLTIAAAVCFFYRPIVGVYAAVLLVPAEALNLSFGSFGLTPTKAILLLVGGVVSLRFIASGRLRGVHPAYVAFIVGQAITILGVLVAKDTFVVFKLFVTWSAFLAVSMLVASAEPGQIKKILYCMTAGGAILAIESIAHGTHQTLVNGGLAATDRAQGSFTHPAQLGFWLVLATAPALVLAILSRHLARALILLAAGLSIAGLLLTLTRGAILGFAGSLIVLMLWPRFRRAALVLLIAGGVFAALNFGALSRSRELSVVTTRLSTVTQGIQTGGKRIQIWDTTPRIIADHPLLGVGAGNFKNVSLEYGLSEGGQPFEHAHNVALTIAAERGLGGLAMLFIFVLAIARTGFDALRRPQSDLYPYALALCAALFGTSIESLVDYPPGQDAVMGTIMIVVGALIALERHMRSQPTSGSPLATQLS